MSDFEKKIQEWQQRHFVEVRKRASPTLRHMPRIFLYSVLLPVGLCSSVVSGVLLGRLGPWAALIGAMLGALAGLALGALVSAAVVHWISATLHRKWSREYDSKPNHV